MHTFVVLAYKESSYLEECIKSVLNQKYPSKVVIATSTPNQYIENIADIRTTIIFMEREIFL